jgi:hypothetical protein
MGGTALVTAVVLAGAVLYGMKTGTKKGGGADTHHPAPPPTPSSHPATSHDNHDKKAASWKQTWILAGTLVVLGGIAFGLFSWIRGLDAVLGLMTSDSSLQIGVAVAAFIAAIAMLVYFPAIRQKYLAIVGATAFVIVVIELFENHMLVGSWRTAIYVVAIGIGLMLKNVGEGKLAIAFAFAVFGTLGLSHLYMSYEDAWAHMPWVSSTRAPATTIASCSGMKEYALTNRVKTNINPGGQCNPDFFWPDGFCIHVQRASWTGDSAARRICDGDVLPKDVEWAWSDTPLTLGVRLAPPKYN